MFKWGDARRWDDRRNEGRVTPVEPTNVDERLAYEKGTGVGDTRGDRLWRMFTAVNVTLLAARHTTVDKWAYKQLEDLALRSSTGWFYAVRALHKLNRRIYQYVGRQALYDASRYLTTIVTESHEAAVGIEGKGDGRSLDYKRHEGSEGVSPLHFSFSLHIDLICSVFKTRTLRTTLSGPSATTRWTRWTSSMGTSLSASRFFRSARSSSTHVSARGYLYLSARRCIFVAAPHARLLRLSKGQIEARPSCF